MMPKPGDVILVGESYCLVFWDQDKSKLRNIILSDGCDGSFEDGELGDCPIIFSLLDLVKRIESGEDE